MVTSLRNRLRGCNRPHTAGLLTLLRDINQDVFATSLIVYILLLLAEGISYGFVSFFLNMNWLLGILLVSGVLFILLPKAEADEGQEARKRDVAWAMMLIAPGALAAIILLRVIGDLGGTAYAISIPAGILTSSVFFFIMDGER